MEVKKQKFFLDFKPESVLSFVACCCVFLVWVLQKSIANTLISDEWTMVDILIGKPVTGAWDLLSRAWYPHNQHRHFLPRMAEWLNSLIDLSPMRLCFVSLIVSAIALWIIREIYSNAEDHRRSNLIFVALATLFYFLLSQKSNWTVGIYLIWPLTALGFWLCLKGLAHQRRLWMWSGFAIAYLSSLAWPALLVPLVYDNIQRSSDTSLLNRTMRAAMSKRLWIVIAAGIFYFWNMPTVENAPAHTEPFSLLRAVGLFVQIIGSPFQWVDSIIGWYFGLLGTIGAIYLLLWGPASRKDSEFWLKVHTLTFQYYILLAALTFTFITAFARWDTWQWSDAAPDRYSVMIIPVWLVLFRHVYDWLINRSKLLVGGFFLVLSTAIVITNVKALHHERYLQTQQKKSDLCLRAALQGSMSDEEAAQCTGFIFPDFIGLKGVANRLHERGYYPWTDKP